MVIKGKFLPPTNYKNPRAKVTHKRDDKTTYSKTIEWNNNIDPVDNCYNACIAMLKEWDLKEYNDAVSNYQKAIEINSNLPNAHNNLGLVFSALNDHQNAINSYKNAV